MSFVAFFPNQPIIEDSQKNDYTSFKRYVWKEWGDLLYHRHISYHPIEGSSFIAEEIGPDSKTNTVVTRLFTTGKILYIDGSSYGPNHSYLDSFPIEMKLSKQYFPVKNGLVELSKKVSWKDDTYEYLLSLLTPALAIILSLGLALFSQYVRTSIQDGWKGERKDIIQIDLETFKSYFMSHGKVYEKAKEILRPMEGYLPEHNSEQIEGTINGAKANFHAKYEKMRLMLTHLEYEKSKYTYEKVIRTAIKIVEFVLFFIISIPTITGPLFVIDRYFCISRVYHSAHSFWHKEPVQTIEVNAGKLDEDDDAFEKRVKKLPEQAKRNWQVFSSQEARQILQQKHQESLKLTDECIAEYEKRSDRKAQNQLEKSKTAEGLCEIMDDVIWRSVNVSSHLHS